MQTLSPPAGEPPLRSLSELESIFREAEKPASSFRVGAEAEKFAVCTRSLEPVAYQAEGSAPSILAVFERLQRAHGWQPVAEREDGPVVALRRGKASITLEPGGQLELSGAPASDVHAVGRELLEHFAELAEPSRELGLSWLGVGFHPLARVEELSWVPKERYAIMREYLPSRGPRGRDMMQRTATVQANFDFSSEQDALLKLTTLLRISPVLQALSANSPFIEGKVSERLSERSDVWLNMDPQRSGIIESLWNREPKSYRSYIDWALDAGMFFFKREGKIVHNTGQTFREFLNHGFEGHFPTSADWQWHLGTLFPEVRLKTTLEVRSCDSLPLPLSLATIALLTGLLYDPDALARTRELAEGITLQDARAARLQLPLQGLSTPLGNRTLISLAEQLLDLAKGGLTRRGRLDVEGKSEADHLRPLEELIASGRTPAEMLRGELQPGDAVDGRALERCRVAGPSFEPR